MDEKTRITCSIFQRQEPIIKELTEKINKAEDPKQKIKHAEDLFKEVNVLLMCHAQEENNLDCKNCRTIAGLRKATVELIIKTKKLI